MEQLHVQYVLVDTPIMGQILDVTLVLLVNTVQAKVPVIHVNQIPTVKSKLLARAFSAAQEAR